MTQRRQDLSGLEREFITVSEAAELRGVTRAAIHALIKRKRLMTVSIFGRILLNRGEVERFERDKTGPKMKSKS